MTKEEFIKGYEIVSAFVNGSCVGCDKMSDDCKAEECEILIGGNNILKKKESFEKIIKFDIEKIKSGIEVFDVILGWHKVTKIIIVNNEMTDFEIKREKTIFSYDINGKKDEKDLNPSIVAMKIEYTEQMLIEEIDKIETCDFVFKQDNYFLSKSKTNDWSIDNFIYSFAYGLKYYSKENAEKICKLLNMLNKIKKEMPF